ncbi:MAG: hypothetical protein WCE45_03530 [Sedimentisphaerales bacterium]
MEKKLKAVFAILFVFSLCVKATDMTFTSSGTITDGNTYDNVYVQNNGTVVNMLGGQINYGLSAGGASMFNMSGGSILGHTINIGTLSSFNVYSGTITIDGSLVVNGGAIVNISGGNITADRLKTYPALSNPVTPASVVNINGGNINFDVFEIHGEVNIYRGLFYVDAAWIGGWGNDQPIINIYGSAFNYSPSTQILTGYLLDDNQFTIKGVDSSEYTKFNLIPEPISLLLFGFGLLVLRKKH